MQLRVLGCSGSIAAGSRTTALLLDDDVLIDAGTGVGDLTLDEMVRVDHIFISHSHLDHVLAIGLLADSVTRRRHGNMRPPVRVYALAQTIHALKSHIFNGVIWPDFTLLPSVEQPVLSMVEVRVGQCVTLGERRIEVLPASHTVPAVGYAIQDAGAPEQGAWVYTGDTGPNPALLQRLNAMVIDTLIIETAFGDEELDLARISKHLCPSLLGKELQQIKEPTRVLITHIKPGEVEAVMGEISATNLPHHVAALASGQVLSLPRGDRCRHS